MKDEIAPHFRFTEKAEEPIVVIAWAVTHEQLFKELHDHRAARSRDGGSFAARKFC